MLEKKKVKERMAELETVIKRKERALKAAPAGHIKIVSNHGNWQYYHVQEGSKEPPVYLSKKNMKLATRLAQKSYDQKVLRAAEQELKAWTMLAKFFPERTVEEVYDALSAARRTLVEPIIPTDEEYRRQWEAVEYEPGVFRPNQPVFITDRGERVRSKSEQLIANLLNRLGIPYRYEYPLQLTVDGRPRTWRPDFMILDVKNRKEFYLEHFGLLDDDSERDNYAKKAFWKMKVYEENGLFEGENMIFSFETSRAPLDITYVEMKVRRALRMPPLENQADYDDYPRFAEVDSPWR